MARLLGAIGGCLLLSCSPPPRQPETTSVPDPRPTCLVLSVGDTKGLAHIGVIFALRERGVKIDCVVGTSMGSLVGGLYAAQPQEDPALGYRELFQIYELEKRQEGTERSLFGALAGGTLAALSGGAGAVVALSVLGGGAAGATTTRVKDWDTLHAALLKKLGDRRIESLPIPYVTQYRRISDATSTTVRGGILADEIARSVKNPLLFPHLAAGEDSTIDPGLDELSAVPLNVACREFPGHQLIVSNVTGEKAKVLAESDCPFQEILVPLIDHERARAIRGHDPDYSELIFAGYDAAQALDWTAFPHTKDTFIPPFQAKRVHVSVQLAAENPNGGAWDALGGPPDPVLALLVARCEACEGYGTSAGSLFRVEGPGSSLHFSEELGVLRLRPGFQLGVALVDEDLTTNDPIGSGVLIYDPEKSSQSLEFEGGSVTLEFNPPGTASLPSAN